MSSSIPPAELHIVFQSSGPQMVPAYLIPPSHTKFYKLCNLSFLCSLTSKSLHKKFQYVVTMHVNSEYYQHWHFKIKFLNHTFTSTQWKIVTIIIWCKNNHSFKNLLTNSSLWLEIYLVSFSLWYYISTSPFEIFFNKNMSRNIIFPSSYNCV